MEGAAITSTLVRTACPLDCPDSCSLEVTVSGDRVVRVEGTHDNPLTAGFICAKVRSLPRHLYGPERLTRPLLRRGARGGSSFLPLSWDDALDLLAERLRTTRERSGGEAILPLSYGGSNGLLTLDTLDARLFHRLGASRLLRTVCAAPSGRAQEGLYGRMPGVALIDYEHADLIVIWGCNPAVTGIHLVPVLRRARARGARLVVIDPRSTGVAKRADLHLKPRPGTDLVLALAVVRWLFAHHRVDRGFVAEHTTGAELLSERALEWTLERAARECGVPAAQIEDFARLYADTSPAVMRCGWGVERNRNGGSAVAAILALPALLGKFGVRGGGYTLSNARAFSLRSAAAEPPPDTRSINMNQLGEALLQARDPRIELLFVYNCNPLVTLPHQERVRCGLLRDDLFSVVFDQVMTDTAALADLVLPATTFLEHGDVAKGYGAMILHPVNKVVNAHGETRSNLEVFGALLDRLGLGRPDEPVVAADLVRTMLADRPEASDELAHGRAVVPAAGDRPIQFSDIFPRTADRKVHLCPADLDREAGGLYRYRPENRDPRFPLALLSPATSHTISSTLGQLVKGRAALEMHPDDAAPRSLESGQLIRVFNDLGEVVCPVRLCSDTIPGVVVLPKGLWQKHTVNGSTANALVPDTLSDLGGGACFNDARVEVASLSKTNTS